MARSGSSNLFSLNSLADIYALKSIVDNFTGSQRLFGERTIRGGEKLNLTEYGRRNPSQTQQKKNLKRLFGRLNGQINAIGDKINTIDDLDALSDDQLEKVLKNIGVAKGGLAKKDFYTRGAFGMGKKSILKTLGIDEKTLKTSESAIEGVNAIARTLNQPEYTIASDKSVDDILSESMGMVSYQKAMGVQGVQIDDTIYDGFITELRGTFGTIQDAVSDVNAPELLDLYQRNFSSIYSGAFSDVTQANEAFQESFANFLSMAGSSSHDVLIDVLNKMGGKSFLLESDETAHIKETIENALSTGTGYLPIEIIIEDLKQREADIFSKIEDLVKGKGVTQSNIKEILKLIKMDKSFDERQRREIQKQITQLANDAKMGVESSQETLDSTTVRPWWMRTFDFIRDRIFGAGLFAKGALGFIAHQFQQSLSLVQDIALEQGASSQRVLKEFNILRDEYTSLIRSEGAFVRDQLATSAELLAVQYDLYNKMGRSFGKTDAQTLERIMRIERATGHTTDEISNMLETLKNINLQSVESNIGVVERYIAIADASGISSKALMQDITENSAIYANNLGGASNEMLKLNVQLIRAGLNMKTMTSFLSNFSEVETTLEKTVKASMLAGQQFDFIPVMLAQMNDDIPEATRLLTIELKKMSDAHWASMDGFRKRQLAELLGTSVPELNKLRTGLTDVEKRYNEATQNFAVDTQKLFNQIRHLGWHKVLDAINVSFIKPITKYFENNKGSYEVLIEGLVTGVKLIGNSVRAVGRGLVYIKETIQPVWDWISAGFDKLSSFMEEINKTNHKIENPIKAMGNFFIGSAVLGTLGGVVFKSLKGVFGGTGDKQVSLLTQIRNILLGQPMGGGGWLSKLFGGLGGKTPPVTTGDIVRVGNKSFGRTASTVATTGGLLSQSKSIAGKGLSTLGGLAIGGMGMYGAYDDALSSHTAEWTSYLMGGAGGAWVGSKFGGPVGALVGALVGVGLTEISRQMGSLQKVREDIKQADPSISDRRARDISRSTTMGSAILSNNPFGNLAVFWDYLKSGDLYSDLMETPDNFLKDVKEGNQESYKRFTSDIYSNLLKSSDTFLKDTKEGNQESYKRFVSDPLSNSVTTPIQTHIIKPIIDETIRPYRTSATGLGFRRPINERSSPSLSDQLRPTVAPPPKPIGATVVPQRNQSEKIVLSEDSINKLAMAMSKIQFGVQVKVDAGRNSRTMSKEEMAVRQFRNVPSLQENTA